MSIFGVTITGDHKELATRRFYGVALDASMAIYMATLAAKDSGWTNISVDDLSLLGPVAFTQLSEDLAEDAS